MKGLELSVSKQNGMTCVEYRLGAADVYDDRVSDKVAQLGNIIPFQYKDEDGKRSILSYVHNDLSLEAMLKRTLRKPDVLAILRGLLYAFEIGAAGVQICYLVRDPKYIYVDPENLSVKCLMVPVKQDALGQSDIPDFFRNIVSHMRFDENDRDNYAARILTLINTDHYSNMKLKELVDAEMERMGLFYTREEGLRKGVAEMPAPGTQNRDIRVNRVGVMNNQRQNMPTNGGMPPQGMPAGNPYPQPGPMVPPQGAPMGTPYPQPGPMIPPQGMPTGNPYPQPGPMMPPQGMPTGNPYPRPGSMVPPQGAPVGGNPYPQPSPMMPPQGMPTGNPQPRPMMPGQMPETPKPTVPQPAPEAPKPTVPQPAPETPKPTVPQPAPEAPKPTVPQSAPEAPKPTPAPAPEAPKPTPVPAPEVLKPTPAPEAPKPMPNGSLMGQLGGARPVPHLVRKSTGEIINITKPEFVIGKSKTKADYAIENNNAVSREHCIIIQRDGVNYIKDNNSTNHTYLNGVELQPGKEMLLKHKTEIRMGDEEFVFLLRKGD